MPVNIRKAGNVVNIDLGVNDVNSYELAAVANSFSFNSTTSVVKSRFFQNWGLSVPLNQLIIDGVVPANEAAFNAALATLSTVTTSGGGGGTPGGAVGSIQYNNAGAFGGYLLSGVGNRMVVADAAGALSTQAIPAGAPILPSTQIAFGNGTDPYTSSADFVYDVSGGFFNVGFSGTPLLQISLTALAIGTDDTWIELGPGAGTINVGDFYNSANNTFLAQNDASQTLTYQKGSDVALAVDIANTDFYVQFGSGLTKLDLNHATSSFQLTLVDGTVDILADRANLFYKFGHVATTYDLFIDENSGSTKLEAGTSYLDLKETTTSLIYARGSDVFFNTNSGTPAGFWGNPNANNTSIAWDDVAQTITLTAANGVDASAFFSVGGTPGATDDVVIVGLTNTYTLSFVGGLYTGTVIT